MDNGKLKRENAVIARNMAAPSLRDAKRRSNPDRKGPRTGLLRFARNDRGLAMTVCRGGEAGSAPQ
ncbi:MAG: hypothetical protein LBT00_10425 [Spirochaetaceae bacterium]|nr:hypothetical protein [Spirochaetaceae bacterium]